MVLVLSIFTSGLGSVSICGPGFVILFVVLVHVLVLVCSSCSGPGPRF